MPQRAMEYDDLFPWENQRAGLAWLRKAHYCISSYIKKTGLDIGFKNDVQPAKHYFKSNE